MQTIKHSAQILAQTLEWIVNFSLVPGEMGPAVCWLLNRTTVELRELVEWHKLAITNGVRTELMRTILAHYFPQPIVQDAARVQTN